MELNNGIPEGATLANRHIAIFDLDGCLFDDRHRRHMLPAFGETNPNFDSYHEACVFDPPINEHFLRDHARAGHFILFITARPEQYRYVTTELLQRHFGPLENFALLMRPNDDHTPSPKLKVALFEHAALNASMLANPWAQVVAAYDDREDVLAAYEAAGVDPCRMQLLSTPPPTVGNLLRGMATTFEARNAVYGDNYRMVGPIMRILFPRGVPPHLLGSDQFHLFELKIVKLTRFAISNLQHIDSIHDDAVYSAMIESILHQQKEQQQ